MENDNLNQGNPTGSAESSSISDFTNEVKNFYSGKFPAMLGKFFKNPIYGIREIFEKSTSQGYLNSLILFGSVFILYILGVFLLESKFNFKMILRLSLVPVVFMFFVTLISFGIKSISGKPDFKSELLTGGLCGIPLSIFLLFLIISKMFTGDSFFMSSLIGGLGLIGNAIFIYMIIMMVNVLQQSLLAAKTKETFAWYIAPVGIVLAGWLANKVVSNLLF